MANDDASTSTSAGTTAPSRPRLRTTLAVALADQAALAQVSAAIGATQDIELVATASNADAAIALARDLLPDVLILGVDLISPAAAHAPAPPPPAPIDDDQQESRGRSAPTTDLTDPVAVQLQGLCSRIDTDLPAVRVVVVAPEGVNSYAAVLGGALGCIPPLELADRVVDSTRRVSWGEGLLTPEWARAVLFDLGGRASDRKDAGPLGRPVLTPTELEVLRRTASGATAPAIAAHHAVPERDVNRNAAYALVKAKRLHADIALTSPPDPDSGEPDSGGPDSA